MRQEPTPPAKPSHIPKSLAKASPRQQGRPSTRSCHPTGPQLCHGGPRYQNQPPSPQTTYTCTTYTDDGVQFWCCHLLGSFNGSQDLLLMLEGEQRNLGSFQTWKGRRTGTQQGWHAHTHTHTRRLLNPTWSPTTRPGPFTPASGFFFPSRQKDGAGEGERAALRYNRFSRGLVISQL